MGMAAQVQVQVQAQSEKLFSAGGTFSLSNTYSLEPVAEILFNPLIGREIGGYWKEEEGDKHRKW